MKQITRKCYICDGKGETSINIEADDYIKIKQKYYHTQCYYLKLITKEEMSEKNTLLEIQRIKSLMIEEAEENLYREKFYNLIMKMYNISYLPNYFFIRVSEINKGKYKNIKEPISCMELFDMYNNQKLIAKLEKIAIKKNISKGTDRLYWDLTIVLGEYENYKKWKRKNMTKDIKEDEIKNDLKKLKSLQKNIQEKHKDEVDINDLIIQ